MQRINTKAMIDENNYYGIAALLINQHPDVNELFLHNDKLETMLTYAMLVRKLDIVRIILAGTITNVTRENSDGETVISLARKLDREAFIEIINHPKLNPLLSRTNSRTGNHLIHDIILDIIDTPIQFSLRIETIIDKLMLLANENIDINLANNNGDIAINIIFDRLNKTNGRESSFRLMRELIIAIARFPHFNINVCDPVSGMTPLMIAAKHSAALTSAICEMRNLDVNATNAHHETALHIAMRSFSTQTIVRLTRIPGCTLNPRDNQYCTPLMVAGKYNAILEFKFMLNLLIRRGFCFQQIVEDDHFQRLIQEGFSSKIIEAILEFGDLPRLRSASSPAPIQEIAETEEISDNASHSRDYSYSRAFSLAYPDPVVKPLGTPSVMSGTPSTSMLFRPLNRDAERRLAVHGIRVCPTRPVAKNHETTLEIPADKRTKM